MVDEGNTDLLSFMTQLHEDPDLRARFEEDPVGTIDASDLSPEAKSAAKSRDLKQVHQHILQETDGTPGPMPMMMWFFVPGDETGGDPPTGSTTG